MALTSCKECTTNVSVSAIQCPHCGVADPGVSYEEQDLLHQIRLSKATEQSYIDDGRNNSAGILNRLLNPIFGGIAKECFERAENEANHRRGLEAKLADVRRKKT